MQRFSRKRQAIMDNLAKRCDHPSASMVYDSLRENYPEISLGTVYRNLNELAENGMILRFTHNGKDRFDGNTSPHCHFCCTQCGNIYDAFNTEIYDSVKRAADNMGFGVEELEIVAKGRCKACQGLI